MTWAAVGFAAGVAAAVAARWLWLRLVDVLDAVRELDP